jgi:hypothetical protein
MEMQAHAWLLVVPFIVVTSFTVLSLFIALIVNSMQLLQAETNQALRAEAVVADGKREALLEGSSRWEYLRALPGRTSAYRPPSTSCSVSCCF